MKKVETVSKELGVPVDSINRYVRERKLIRNGVVIAELVEGKDFGKNADGNRIVKASSIQAYRKLKKPTGRPRKIVRVFKFDWDVFYKKIENVSKWLDRNNFERSQFYRIKNGDTYPTKEEIKKLNSPV